MLNRKLPEKGRIIILTNIESGVQHVGYFACTVNNRFFIGRTDTGKTITGQSGYFTKTHVWKYVKEK